MKLKWFGQACFLLISNLGTRVFMDPYKMFSHKVPEVEADIVTTSHDHFDHNYVKAVKGDFTHINTAGNYTHEDIKITGTLTYHDDHLGTKRGSNIIFNFAVDGIKLCHCGDLGHLLTEEQITSIGKVDVLLVNVGGIGVIKAPEVFKVCKQLNPVITIPMHYKSKSLGFIGRLFAKVEKFLESAGGNAQEVDELTLDSKNITDYAGIITMKY